MVLTYGEKRALNEIRSVLDLQWKNGMIPHIRFARGEKGYSPDENEWGVTRDISGIDKRTSGITQPPIIGYVLHKIYQKSKNKNEVLLQMDKFYKKINDYHEFLFRERDPNGENLVAVIHPWETGTDNTPYQDKPIDKTKLFLRIKKYEQRISKRKDIQHVSRKYRPTDKDYECFGRLIGFYVKHNYNQEEIVKKSPYLVQDVMFNSILAASVDSLSRLAGLLSSKFQGRKKDFYIKEKRRQKELYERISGSIQKKFYDRESGMFYSYDMVEGRPLKVDTVHCLSPLFGNCATRNQAKNLIRRMFSRDEFSPGAMIATTSLKSSQFDNLKYWRGPVWPAPINWLLYEGLKNYDRKKAGMLKEKTINIIECGFRFPRKKSYILASSLMEYNSFREKFTTPSKNQYHHGWLWDSCFAAIGWVNVKEKPKDTTIWESISDRFVHLKGDKGLEKINSKISREFGIFLFDEYYTARKDKNYRAGEPIGSPMMTWNAALYLDLKNFN